MPSLICSRDGSANPIQALLCSQCGRRLSRVEVGSLFVERYLVNAFLRETPTGFCYLVQVSSTGKSCVLREIIPPLAGQREQLIRFTRAAQYLMKVRPQCLPPVLEHFSHRSCYYTVEAVMDGEDLQHMIEKNGALSEARAGVLFDAMLAALKQLYSLDQPVCLGGLNPAQVLCQGENAVFFLDSSYLSDNVMETARPVKTTLAEDLCGAAQVTALGLTKSAESDPQSLVATLLSLQDLSLACTLDWLSTPQVGGEDLLAKVEQFRPLVAKADSAMKLGQRAEAVDLLKRAYQISHSQRIKAELDKLEKSTRSMSVVEKTPQSAVADVRQAPKPEAAPQPQSLQQPPSPAHKEIPFLKPIPLPASTAFPPPRKPEVRTQEHLSPQEPSPLSKETPFPTDAPLPASASVPAPNKPEAQLRRQSSTSPKEIPFPKPVFPPAPLNVQPPGKPAVQQQQQLLLEPKETIRSVSPSVLSRKPDIKTQPQEQSSSLLNEAGPLSKVSPSPSIGIPNEVSSVTQSAAFRANKKWWLVLAAIAIVSGAVLIALWISSSLLRRFNAATEQGHLVSPPEANAYDLYKTAAQSDSPGSSRLREMKDKAQPPLKRFSDDKLGQFRKNSYLSVAEWDDLAKAQEWLASMNPADAATVAKKEFADAQVSLAHHRPQEALSGFQRALQQQPGWDLALLGIGNSCFELKRYACADEYYTRASQQSPNWIGPYRALMELYRAQNDKVRSCAEYNTFIGYSGKMAPPPSDLEPIKARMENFCNNH